jgi:hypothetical protein
MIAQGGKASFADLALSIVNSRQFRNKVGDEEMTSGSTHVERTPSKPAKAGNQ